MTLSSDRPIEENAVVLRSGWSLDSVKTSSFLPASAPRSRIIPCRMLGMLASPWMDCCCLEDLASVSRPYDYDSMTTSGTYSLCCVSCNKGFFLFLYEFFDIGK